MGKNCNGYNSSILMVKMGRLFCICCLLLSCESERYSKTEISEIYRKDSIHLFKLTLLVKKLKRNLPNKIFYLSIKNSPADHFTIMNDSSVIVWNDNRIFYFDKKKYSKNEYYFHDSTILNSEIIETLESLIELKRKLEFTEILIRSKRSISISLVNFQELLYYQLDSNDNYFELPCFPVLKKELLNNSNLNLLPNASLLSQGWYYVNAVDNCHGIN